MSFLQIDVIQSENEIIEFRKSHEIWEQNVIFYAISTK